MNLVQILSLAIFLVMFVTIIIGKVHRYIPALIGAALTLLVVYLIVLRSPISVINAFRFQQLGDPRFWLPRGARV